MTSRVRNAGVAVAGAALLASGAYALGSQAGDGSASAKGDGLRAAPVKYGFGYGVGGAPRRFERRHFGERTGPFGLDALAQNLGVSPDALRSALADIKQSLPRDDDLAAKLADALGLPVDKVTAALKQ